VRDIGSGLVLVCACLPLLSGCGSGSSAPYTLACTVHRLAGGQIRADVTVKNTTSRAGNPIMYSPVLFYLRRYYPIVLQPTRVVVDGQGGQTSYIGFVLPHVRPNAAMRVQLTFLRPPHARPLVVTATNSVQSGDSSPLDNPDCVIQ
jgi:hypothetical protein